MNAVLQTAEDRMNAVTTNGGRPHECGYYERSGGVSLREGPPMEAVSVVQRYRNAPLKEGARAAVAWGGDVRCPSAETTCVAGIPAFG